MTTCLFTNSVFVKRATGVGTMTRQQALEWGVTGPNLRATGLAFDVRRDDPYLIYDQLDFEIPTEAAGDAWARALVRRQELMQSISIVQAGHRKNGKYRHAYTLSDTLIPSPGMCPQVRPING
jgi:NADH:ubiquinone oxidoreductase subunit D